MWPRSALQSAGIGKESCRFDAGNGAGFVLVRGVAGNPDRADDLALGVADQHAAGVGHHTSATSRIERVEELRRVGGALIERARAEAHAERTPCFAVGDVV